MQVNSFPIRIITRVESSTISIELVGEDQFHFRIVSPRLFCVSFLRCVQVD